jgi:putative ABC transport system permease protein
MARWSRFRRLFGPEPKGDVDAELAFHVEMRVRELVEQGVPPERARALALRRFGDYDRSREECVEISERRERRMARTEYMTELRQDVGYALRMLRRAPGFTAVALTTLALGIGANSAIFSVVQGVLLAPLPFRDADRLHRVTTLYPDGTPYSLSPPDFMSVREQTQTLEQVEAYSGGVFTMLGAGEPREVRGTYVSDGLFGMLGLPLALGRTLLPGENRPGHEGVAVLDHGFWQRQFGGDRSVLGRTITIAGAPFEIVGVLAPAAHIVDDSEIFAPLVYDERFSAATANGRRGESLTVIGRAKPGMTLSQVNGDVHRIGLQLQQQFRQTNDTLTFNARPLEDVVLGDVRRPLFVLLGAVGFVLLVACANVANLLLARASARQAELAVRCALGAGRVRLLRQLLTEAIVLGLAGAVAGLAIAYLATRALVAVQPAGIPRLEEVGVNAGVVWFTFAIALATSLAFGVLPALQFSGKRLPNALRESTRGGASGGGQHMRAALVVAEMALAVVLLIGAGLLIRSFIKLTRVDPGFRAEQALSFRVTLQGQKYREDGPTRLRVAEFEERLRALPGVTTVGATSVLPLSGRGSMVGFAVEGAPPPPPTVNPEIAVVSATPDYFRAIGAPLRRGRQFTDQDHTQAPRVAIVNDAAVRRWLADRDPIGARVNINGVTRVVVGVAADVLQRSPAEPAAPMIFVPFAQRTIRSVKIVVRATGDPVALATAIRTEIRALDPELAIAGITPLTQLVARSMARPRFYTSLLALFAAVALVLAATGVFGVMSYAVAQRAREISIRMALGAVPRDVLRMIVGRALGLSAIGIAMGLAAAIALGRFIQGQLFGVTVFDPVTLGAVAIVLGASAVLASFLPARRATKFDPASALREG